MWSFESIQLTASISLVNALLIFYSALLSLYTSAHHLGHVNLSQAWMQYMLNYSVSTKVTVQDFSQPKWKVTVTVMKTLRSQKMDFYLVNQGWKRIWDIWLVWDVTVVLGAPLITVIGAVLGTVAGHEISTFHLYLIFVLQTESSGHMRKLLTTPSILRQPATFVAY